MHFISLSTSVCNQGKGYRVTSMRAPHWQKLVANWATPGTLVEHRTSHLRGIDVLPLVFHASRNNIDGLSDTFGRADPFGARPAFDAVQHGEKVLVLRRDKLQARFKSVTCTFLRCTCRERNVGVSAPPSISHLSRSLALALFRCMSELSLSLSLGASVM